MAAKISETEYAALRKRAGKNVRFIEDAPQRASAGRGIRRARTTGRRRARRTNFMREAWPVLAIAGGVGLLGFVASREQGLHGLGNCQDGAVGKETGSMVGNIVGSITGIPGIGMVMGQIGGLIGGLFGPGVHRTPGGETYDAATYELHQGYFAMMDLVNQVRATGNLPALSMIGFIGLGTPGCDALPDNGSNCSECEEQNCGAVNAPLTGPYLAKLLGDPSYASMTAEAEMTQLQALGAYDAGIQAQQAIIERMQFILESVQTGTMVWQSGSIVPVGGADYQSQTGTAPAQAAAGSYGAVQSSGGFLSASLSSDLENYGPWIAGVAALLLIAKIL